MMSRTASWGLLLVVLCPGLSGRGDAQAAGIPPVSVMINEVLASNENSLSDLQGQYEDWIELYNAGAAPVDLAGCYLTDDLARPTKWQFPAGNPAATTILAQGYLVIWADGDVADPGLHAGFRLNDEGEEVGLFAADGVTLIDSLSFGPQLRNVSYGRYPDGSAELRQFSIPTPGVLNLVFHEGIVAAPQFDVTSRICTGPIVVVTLATATPGASICYTTDGTNPFSLARERPAGTDYTGPLTISRTTTVKAVAWRPGWRQSDVSEQRYVFVGRDLQGFSSPLAIAVVDTSGKNVSRASVPAFGCFIDVGPDGRASLTGPVSYAGPGAINVRGKSSEGFPKHQYHFETQDSQGKGEEAAILGLPAESDWVLQGMYSDKSLMRNVLAYQWSNEMGRWAAHTRFVELFLNSDDSTVNMADYVGVYVLMEKIKIGPHRVDVAELEPSDNAEPEITGGYIIKKDKTEAGDQWFVTNRGQQMVYQDPNALDLTQPQKDWIRGYVNSFEAALYGPNFKDPVDGYARFIDVASFIDNHILIELTKNVDGFRLSTYFHKDRAGKLVMGPVWDYDLSLGNAADYWNDGWLPTGWYFSHLGDGDYPYWRRLFEDPEFKLRYADRWFALRRDLFATNRLVGIIEDYATLLDEPAARNFNRWQILGKYVWPNWFIAKTYREEIAWIQKWVTDRLAWMDSQIATEFAPAPPAFNQQGGRVETGFSLLMSAPGTIYYTTDGSDPKLLLGPVQPTNSTVLVPESASKRVLVPAGPVDDAWRGGGAFDDSAWTLTAGGIGFERATGYESLFRLDVESPMYNKSASCYVRIPFHISANPRNWGTGTLRVRYDDGFVAYLNGVEIARRNVTGDPAWNSAAGSQHDDAAAVIFESIEVADIGKILRRADNVLALHALNVSTTSSDFLISADLTAREIVVEPSAPAQLHQYAGPVPLNESTRIIARSLDAGRWSAANEAVFAVGPVAESVRISEIMYHPIDPNAEFIELTNVGAAAVNLSLMRLSHGVEFTFPSVSLAPAGYCVAVKDPAAFEAAYGPGLPVAGQYAGSLDNAGERLELQDAGGQIVQGFTYRDSWYDSTDGAGFSLVLTDPRRADPNALDSAAAWRPSTHPGGSPGASD